MTALIVLACSGVLSARQELTLPELARRQAPEPLFQARIAEILAVPMQSFLPNVDLVVYGTVDRADTYLAADQMDLFTDYVITPLRTISLAGNRGTRPAPSRPIVVKRWGGQAIIEGFTVTQENSNLRAFQVGEEVLLLLTHNQSDQKYGLTSETSGTFSVEAMRLRPFVDLPGFDQMRGMTVEQFETEVRRLSRR